MLRHGGGPAGDLPQRAGCILKPFQNPGDCFKRVIFPNRQKNQLCLTWLIFLPLLLFLPACVVLFYEVHFGGEHNGVGEGQENKKRIKTYVQIFDFRKGFPEIFQKNTAKSVK